MYEMAAKVLGDAVTTLLWLFIPPANDQEGPLIMIVEHVQIILVDVVACYSGLFILIIRDLLHFY